MESLSRRLVDYALSFRFEDLDPAVVHEVRRRTLDSFGCAYGAFAGDVGGIVRRLAAGVRSEPGATLFGGGSGLFPPLAAFANGAMVRYLDYNDTYLSLEPAHPSDNIPACFAAAEAAGAAGRDLIAAIALAYEVQCRLCDATSIRARGWDHVTYGAFSTALAAGRLLGLDRERMEHAVALAGVNAAAVRQTRVGHLSHWKGCAFANAARNGVFAAWLAAGGMTGPDQIFEGQMGFMAQVSGPFTLEPERWGPPSMILNTSIKYWPAEYHSQSAIDVALSLRPRIAGRKIDAVRIDSFDAAVDIIGGETEKWHPTTRETADHSMPYCVAVALLDGEVGLGQFSEERILAPDVRALMPRITVERDAALTARYPEGIPNRLRVSLADGEVLEHEVTYPRGHARNPMTDDEVLAKYGSLASLRLPAGAVEGLRKLVWSLEEQQPGAVMAATAV